MHISEVFFKKKTIFWFLIAAIVAGGVYAYIGMGKLEDPEIAIKQAMVVTVYPGASAHEVELNVTAVIENELNTLNDVSSINSTSTANMSMIMVELSFSVPDKAVEQRWDILRRKVGAAAAKLPSDALAPIVVDDISDVYGMFYAMTADGYSYEEMDKYARYVKQELLNVEGVRRIEIYGMQEPCINIELSGEKMAHLGVLPAQILTTIDGQNKPVFAGVYEGGDQQLRVTVSDRFQSIDHIRNLIIQSVSGEQIRLGDIAGVSRGYREPVRNVFRLNNRDALAVSIATESGENVINVGKRVESRLAEIQANLPVGVEFEKVFFQPDRVRQSINGFVWNLLSSVLIVILVLMLTMGFRGGMIIGSGLLLTVLATFPVLLLFGGTLQRISLGAFIVAMGMLVDNAIVVIDGILVGLGKGDPLKKALFSTARQTAMPLLGATVIAIATFLPVFLTDDTAGVYARDLFLVLCISLLVSWFLALVQVPMFSAYFLKWRRPRAASNRHLPLNTPIHLFIRRMLEKSLRRKILTLTGSLVCLALAVLAFLKVQNRFFPDFNYNQLYIEYTLPDGTASARVNRDLYDITGQLLGFDHVRTVASSQGKTPSRYCLLRAVNMGADNYGELIVDFDSYPSLTKMKPVVEKFLRENYPDAYIRVRRYNFSVATSHTVEVQFSGPDPAVLRSLSRQAQEVMRDCPEVDAYTVCDNLQQPGKALVAAYAQSAARRAGVTRSDVSNALLAATDGIPVGTFYENDETLNIYLKTRTPDGKRMTDPDDVPVWAMLPHVGIDKNTVAGLMDGSIAPEELKERMIASVPLSQVSEGVQLVWEEAMVYRNDGRRAVEVQCDPLENATPAAVCRSIRRQIENIPLPAGYSLKWLGEGKLQHNALANMLGMIPVAALIILLTLLLLFNDIRKLLIVLCCLPFAVIGISPAMLAAHQPFTFMAIIGVMGLAGMLIKNSIVLIDEITRLIREGTDPYHAVIEATVARTRPVVMASFTTVLGMLPLILDPMYASLAVAVMAGLIAGTLVTLILVPIFYAVFFQIERQKASS
ncbi:MAG: efflux RND transporter permease subunit [Bacteroidales bacterium]|jgi:multidrug efflux pump subunit AcrB|nr:efflux RND transporter permease subunit [Bacteroidales bacterium]